jgi:hypothetical protein
VNESIYAVLLHSLMVSYIKLVILLTESARSGTDVFVKQDYHSPIRTKNCGCVSLAFILH